MKSGYRTTPPRTKSRSSCSVHQTMSGKDNKRDMEDKNSTSSSLKKQKGDGDTNNTTEPERNISDVTFPKPLRSFYENALRDGFCSRVQVHGMGGGNGHAVVNQSALLNGVLMRTRMNSRVKWGDRFSTFCRLIPRW